MSIDIANNSSIIYDMSALEHDAERLLSLLCYVDFNLSITLTDNNEIQMYNREYRDKDKPTDVLSFPFHPELKAGERIKVAYEDEKDLGDIIISLEYVKEDASNWDQTFDERMRVLLVHGICHLLGYDHIEDEDYKVMKKQEDWLLDELSKNA